MGEKEGKGGDFTIHMILQFSLIFPLKPKKMEGNILNLLFISLSFHMFQTKHQVLRFFGTRDDCFLFPSFPQFFLN